jgi:hypothetical protein
MTAASRNIMTLMMNTLFCLEELLLLLFSLFFDFVFMAVPVWFAFKTKQGCGFSVLGS